MVSGVFCIALLQAAGYFYHPNTLFPPGRSAEQLPVFCNTRTVTISTNFLKHTEIYPTAPREESALFPLLSALVCQCRTSCNHPVGVKQNLVQHLVLKLGLFVFKSRVQSFPLGPGTYPTATRHSPTATAIGAQVPASCRLASRTRSWAALCAPEHQNQGPGYHNSWCN